MSKNVEQLIVLSKFVELCRTAAQTIDAMAKGEEYTKAEQRWITETKDRLAQRRGKKPATKAGQLRALWPEIRAAIAEGQSLATIRQWLEEEAGIAVTVQSLGSYLTRIRRKERATPSAPTPPAPAPSKPPLLRRAPRYLLTSRKRPGSSTLRVLQTKASSSESGLVEKKYLRFGVPLPLRHFLYKQTRRFYG